MNRILPREDIELIEARIKTFEVETGCELLLIHAQSSDEYPGASWRFSVLSSFILHFIFSIYFDFEHTYFWPLSILTSTLILVKAGQIPWVKRLTLVDQETNRECHEKAVESFFNFGTSKVSHKVTAMIMVSILERKIIVLVDETLKAKISQQDLDELVLIMTIHFKSGDMKGGFLKSIEDLQSKILKKFGTKVSEISPSELKDEIIFI